MERGVLAGSSGGGGDADLSGAALFQQLVGGEVQIRGLERRRLYI